MNNRRVHTSANCGNNLLIMPKTGWQNKKLRNYLFTYSDRNLHSFMRHTVDSMTQSCRLAACREGEFVKALLAFSKKFCRHYIQTKWYQNGAKADLKSYLDNFCILWVCEIFTVVHTVQE